MEPPIRPRPSQRRRDTTTNDSPLDRSGNATHPSRAGHGPALQDDRIQIDTILSDEDERSLADDVLAGLTGPQKELPPKHFYDSRGAGLFDRICDLPEYYPTRVEREILHSRASEIASLTGAGELVELGSGTAAKTRVLLDALQAAGTLRKYVPFDVTEALVRETAHQLTSEYSNLAVHGVVGDFERHLSMLPPPDRQPRLLAFLGGTIGNFPPASRRRLLRKMANTLRPSDHLLMGTDLVKDPRVIEAAYNDSEGITAEFNRNLLHVINRDLDANFDTSSFDHIARFDPHNQWIEMRLRSLKDQTVTLRSIDLSIHFDPGEEILTEISAKFTLGRLLSDLSAAGLTMTHWMTDPHDQFALSLSQPSPAPS